MNIIYKKINKEQFITFLFNYHNNNHTMDY